MKHNLQSIINLELTEFIISLYENLLDRVPSTEEFQVHLRSLIHGMPREALIHIFITSAEFADRFEVENSSHYQSIYESFMHNKKNAEPPRRWLSRFFRAIRLFPDQQKQLFAMELEQRLLSANMDFLLRKREWDQQDQQRTFQKNSEYITTHLSKEFCTAFESLSQDISSCFFMNEESAWDQACRFLASSGYVAEDQSAVIQAQALASVPDLSDEFSVYNHISWEAIQPLLEDNSVVVGHFSNQLVNSLHQKQRLHLEAVAPDFCNILSKSSKQNSWMILNPSLSALLLLTPNALYEVAQRTKNRLVLLIRTREENVCATWTGFSYPESENGSMRRWAMGETSKATIRFYNLTQRSLRISIAWKALALCGYGELTASLRGKKVSAPLTTNYSEMSLESTLLPGENRLHFSFSGIPVQLEGEYRNLSFCLLGLTPKIEGITMDNDPLYNNHHAIFTSEKAARLALHKSGFYDVTAYSYSNHGFSKRDLGRSKYLYPNRFSMIDSAETSGLQDGIVVLEASRLDRQEGRINE